MTVINIGGKRVTVSDDFMKMSPEDQARTVDEIAQMMDFSRQKSQPIMPVVNEGIARGADSLLGLPNVAVNAVIRGGAALAGVDDPYQFSETPVRDVMGLAGIETVNRAPENLLEQGLMGAGEAASYLIPAAGVARGMQAGGALARGIGSAIMDPFLATPARAIGTELAAGAGARVGGEVAADAAGGTYGDVARPFGELAGGLAAAAGPGAALRFTGRAISKTPVAGTILRTGKAIIAPFTEAGARVRAENRVQGMTADPAAAAAAMDQPNPGNLTPAQLTGDENLMRLENTVAARDPALGDQLSKRAAQSSETLRGEFAAPAKGEGTPATREFIEKRRAEFRGQLEKRAAAAQETAREKVMKLDPARRESENAVIVREELDKAYDRSSQQERALWSRVPKDARVQTETAKRVFAEIDADTGRARAEDIPREARMLLSGDSAFGDLETVREMHALYSQMRQRAREAISGAAPNENRARIANMIADAILEDLGATGGIKTSVGRVINEARAYSREINEVFGQGTVGKLTARQRSGGDAIAPEASLAATVGQGGVKGAVAVQDIRRAAGPSVDPSIEDYMRGQITDRAASRGEFSPEKAGDFQRANREVLQEFPGLSGDIGAAQMATRSATAKTDRINDIVKALDDPKRSVTAAFLHAAPEDEIAAAIFKSRRPAAAAREIRRQAGKDPSGRAVDGLKGAFIDHLMAGAKGPADTTGIRTVRGTELYTSLRDPKIRAAATAIFDAPEIARMERIAREFQKLEMSRKAGTLDSVIDDPVNTLISFAGRVMGARSGAKLGKGTSGASLLTAGFASKRMQRLLESLTNDRAEAMIKAAVGDRDLFRALLLPSAKLTKRAESRIIEWAIGTGAVTAAELGEE